MNATRAIVGIVANPASGKDIRRLVAHATTIDNQGKIGIVRRVLIGLGTAGTDQVLIMPDQHHLGNRALEGLRYTGEIIPPVELLDMPILGEARDSERAAQLLRKAGAGCIIILGGDGTVRAVSKEAGIVPLLPISTGTNNVLPSFIEGTIAGLAAGAVARAQVPLAAVAVQHKWLELLVNGVSQDRALVDVAVVEGRFVGSRAVWSASDIRQVVVTRADPASIGISAIAGVVQPVAPEEPLGLALQLTSNGARRVMASIGPGLITEVGIEAVQPLHIGERLELIPERPLVVALDGEREVVLRAGDDASVLLRDDGPWIVDARRVMEAMVAQHLYDR